MSGQQRTARGHLHVEAFCLMWYACPCGHQERIWNSRDGVTPFGSACPSCGEATLQHVRWREDTYAPQHAPPHGQRQWIDMTRERAAFYVDRRIAAFEAHGHPLDPSRRQSLIDDFFSHGSPSPDLLVTGYCEAAPSEGPK